MSETTQSEARVNPRPAPASPVRYDVSLLTAHDLYLFNEGTHFRLHERLGAHATIVDGTPGAYFAVWAPDAERVSVIGDFNDWTESRHPLRARASSGIWEGFIPEVTHATRYKYHLVSR